MAGGSIKLARIFGIRIGATPSWFIVLFVLIYLLTGHFRDVLDGSDSQAFLTAVIAAVLFEVSIVVHEIGHAVVARRYGIGTEGIDLWFFGGLAKLDREPDTPGREFAVAFAGPALTAVVVLLCWIAASILGHGGSFMDQALFEDETATPAVALIAWLATVNVFLLGFNLIPAYPLDGGRIAKAAAWKVTGDRNRGLRAAARVGQAFSVALIGFGIYVGLRGDTFNGIWFAVLGWFMMQGASGAVASSSFSERIDGVTVGDLMDTQPVWMPADTTLIEARDDFFHRYQWPWFAVADPESGHFHGVLSLGQVEQGIAEGRPALPVRDVLDAAAEQAFSVDARTPLESLIGSEGLRALGALMVVDDAGRLQGVVTVEQVRRALTAAAGR
jgi:Zn-dependent protease